MGFLSTPLTTHMGTSTQDVSCATTMITHSMTMVASSGHTLGSGQHIYRERNVVSDLLSKEAAHLLRDQWEIQEQHNHN